MKKNKMMRLASVLLIAVLLTTSVISGTFAKYVTEGSASDSARVAKFGVVVSASGELFATNYYSATTTYPSNGGNGSLKNQPAVAGRTNDDREIALLTVESSNGDKLVAPGTQNDKGVTVSLTGTPEVDVLVTFDMDVNEQVFLKAENYEDLTTDVEGTRFDLTADYYPIVFTLKQGNEVLATGNSNEIKDALKAASLYYDANTNLAEATDSAYTLTWKWAYEQENNDDGMYDKADTLLGDLAAGTTSLGSDYRNLNIDVTFSVTVTQVD